MKKDTAIASIKEMPQDFELDDLIERLVVLDKIERGREDVRNGQTISHEEAKSELSKWLE